MNNKMTLTAALLSMGILGKSNKKLFAKEGVCPSVAIAEKYKNKKVEFSKSDKEELEKMPPGKEKKKFVIQLKAKYGIPFNGNLKEI